MPKLKSNHISPSVAEDAAIDAAIVLDPDTRQVTALDIAAAGTARLLPNEGKKRITIWLDNDVIEAFKLRAAEQGMGYQTAINAALREAMQMERPLTETALRRILREEWDRK